MPSWILPASIVAYGSIIVLLTLASAFSYEKERRDAAFRVLNVMVPWGIVALLIHMKMQENDPARVLAAITPAAAADEADDELAREDEPAVRGTRPLSRARGRRP